MGLQAGLFDIEERLRDLSAKGDDLERINALVDSETFRPKLERIVPRSDRAQGGRPPYDHVLMFRLLILQASHSLSDERTGFLRRFGTLWRRHRDNRFTCARPRPRNRHEMDVPTPAMVASDAAEGGG